jgi:hypothetical protein
MKKCTIVLLISRNNELLRWKDLEAHYTSLCIDTNKRSNKDKLLRPTERVIDDNTIINNNNNKIKIDFFSQAYFLKGFTITSISAVSTFKQIHIVKM